MSHILTAAESIKWFSILKKKKKKSVIQNQFHVQI